MSRAMKRHQSFVGVYYRDSSIRTQKGKRPDRSYYFTYKDSSGRKRGVCAGWESDGVTAETANKQRLSFISEKKIKTKVSGVTEVTLLDVWQKYSEAYSEMKSYEFYKSYFKKIHEVVGDKKLKDITEYDFAMLVKRMSKNSPVYTKNVIRFASFLIKCAIKWRMYEGGNPAEDIKVQRYDWNRTRMLSVGEAELLLDHLRRHNPLLHDITYVALYTGMRLNEILSLDANHIDLKEKKAILFNTKTGMTGYVFLSSEVVSVLKRNISGIGNIPVFKNGSGRIKDKWVQDNFKNSVDKLGLNSDATDSRQRVVFHTLRHTFASWMMMNGEALPVVQRLMRHVNVNMTLRYTHLSDEVMRKALSRIQEKTQISTQ